MTCLAHPDTSSAWLSRLLLVGLCAIAGCKSSASQLTDASTAQPDGSIDGGTAQNPDGSVQLSGRLSGDAFELLIKGGKLYHETCQGEPSLQKQVGRTWVALQDDRSSERQRGYYLDQVFVAPDGSLGCDQVFCTPFGDPGYVAFAREYVKTGEKAPPASADYSHTGLVRPSTVLVIESRAFHGKLRAHVRYAKDAACNAFSEGDVDVDVPKDGVCCPIGSAQCSTEGPGGGWAPSLSACPKWTIVYDAAFDVKPDLHGCPQLIEDDTKCCGCVVPDGGS